MTLFMCHCGNQQRDPLNARGECESCAEAHEASRTVARSTVGNSADVNPRKSNMKNLKSITINGVLITIPDGVVTISIDAIQPIVTMTGTGSAPEVTVPPGVTTKVTQEHQRVSLAEGLGKVLAQSVASLVTPPAPAVPIPPDIMKLIEEAWGGPGFNMLAATLDGLGAKAVHFADNPHKVTCMGCALSMADGSHGPGWVELGKQAVVALVKAEKAKRV